MERRFCRYFYPSWAVVARSERLGDEDPLNFAHNLYSPQRLAE